MGVDHLAEGTVDRALCRRLSLGEHAPWFQQRSSTRASFAFDAVGGRYLVLCFFGRPRDPSGRAALDFLQTHRACFNDVRASFFGVSSDSDDETSGRVQHSMPGVWQFWDFDGRVARLYGALPESGDGPRRPMWVVLNPGLRVLAVLHFRADGSDHKALAALLEDAGLVDTLQARVMTAVGPAIQKAHCFHATVMERFLVGCYDSDSGGHFAPHRDNTTRGTAHRRFALSVNLNDDFAGGELGFPEYGPRTYKVPRGRRYAFLPFLYDETAATVREENSSYLVPDRGMAN